MKKNNIKTQNEEKNTDLPVLKDAAVGKDNDNTQSEVRLSMDRAAMLTSLIITPQHSSSLSSQAAQPRTYWALARRLQTPRDLIQWSHSSHSQASFSSWNLNSGHSAPHPLTGLWASLSILSPSTARSLCFTSWAWCRGSVSLEHLLNT